MAVVFDFDKTLTYKDTLFGFFYICSQKGVVRFLKVFLYIFVMVVHKVKLISNDNLKRAGVALFLKGKSKEFLTKQGENYCRSLKLNKIYYNVFLQYERPYVISASFYEYLSPLLPTANIICSEIEFVDGKVKGLKTNCHGKIKYELLTTHGIKRIQKLYTDSIDDLALAQISDEINLVKGDKIISCHDLRHFIEMTNTLL